MQEKMTSVGDWTVPRNLVEDMFNMREKSTNIPDSIVTTSRKFFETLYFTRRENSKYWGSSYQNFRQHAWHALSHVHTCILHWLYFRGFEAMTWTWRSTAYNTHVVRKLEESCESNCYPHRLGIKLSGPSSRSYNYSCFTGFEILFRVLSTCYTRRIWIS